MTEPHFTPEITDDFVKMHEDILVPAIYAQWAQRVADIAEIDQGHQVLDVACGTGPLARAAELETGLAGRVIGIDTSEKMLASADQRSRRIEWQVGDAEALPFEKEQFDRVLCQFSLMFIANRVSAIKEMIRVSKPDGLIVLAVWAPLEQSKAYCTFIDLLDRYISPYVARKVSAPWSLGIPGTMDALLLSAGVNEYECHSRVGLARFPSIESMIETHLRLTGVFHKLDPDAYQNLLRTADAELHPFVGSDGQVVAQLDANIYTVIPA